MTQTRMTKQKRALIDAGYSLEQINAMSAVDRSILLKSLTMQGKVESFEASTDVTVLQPEVLEPVAPKTEEEILAEISESFEALDDLVLSTVVGANKSLIIAGKAGVGKTYGVEKIVKEMSENPVHIKGYCRATGLYRTLYENRWEGSTIVLDDIDSIFNDEVALNILKSACDSSDTRTLHWLSESNMKDEDGELLPRSFEFEGSIIFITNKNLQELADGGGKLAVHIEAMLSRSIYIDLGLRKPEEAMVRIKQVVRDFGMLSGLGTDEQEMVLEWIDNNKDSLRDLSLRTAKKVASLVETSTDKWQALAKRALCRG